GPSERSWTSSAVHLAPITSAVAATAQVVASCTGFMVRSIARSVLRDSGTSVPRWGVVDPPACDHRRDDLHLRELLQLAHERVAVEYDEVGEPSRQERSSDALVVG